MNNRADWLRDKKWGIFTHYLHGCQNSPEWTNNQGRGTTDWNECVEEFNPDLLAKQLHELGASYLGFTINQRTKYMCAPNDTYNRITGYKPGEACSHRDLIEDVYQAINKYHIDLMLYSSGDGPVDDPIAGPAMGFSSYEDKVTTDYVEKWASVLREYSLRYGKKVKAWLVDGCYEFIGYNGQMHAVLADALRAGNPDALVTVNHQLMHLTEQYSDCEDFICGEMNSFTTLPTERFIQGKQLHLWSFLGIPPMGMDENCGWNRARSKYTGEYLKHYVTSINNVGGAVTIDVCLNRDGSIDPVQYDVLKWLTK